MPLGDLTSRDAVLRAIDQFDRLGRPTFLAKYGFHKATDYFVRYRGRAYDSKALAGAAYGFQFPRRGPLAPDKFSGGLTTVWPKLESLGFDMVSSRQGLDAMELPINTEQNWDELGERFGFRPAYLSVAGGMVPVPEHEMLLLITHPGGGKSFDYGDYWDGTDLIYAGRGQTGHQRLEGQNRDVAENRRRLLVFEHVSAARLRYLGEAECVAVTEALAPDRNGVDRRVFQFRLAFLRGSPERVPRPSSKESRNGQAPRSYRRRRFDPTKRPPPPTGSGRTKDPDEILALREKANRRHFQILCDLQAYLQDAGWREIDEIPAAIDLLAEKRGAGRVLFEAKTIGTSNERSQVRSAIAQLLEYGSFSAKNATSCA